MEWASRRPERRKRTPGTTTSLSTQIYRPWTSRSQTTRTIFTLAAARRKSNCRCRLARTRCSCCWATRTTSLTRRPFTPRRFTLRSRTRTQLRRRQRKRPRLERAVRPRPARASTSSHRRTAPMYRPPSRFGSDLMGVAPAGVDKANTGHHHLLIDAPLPPLDKPIPNDENHLHFGGGQIETTLTLPKGKHTLQPLLGDAFHLPHEPPVYSTTVVVYVGLSSPLTRFDIIAHFINVTPKATVSKKVAQAE